ncbi:MAG: hypothetical protein JWM16_2866 [Verrucomicrobiales bacterium]|nr:hypothetical protein [Verrucomicrobiales bacterium]
MSAKRAKMKKCPCKLLNTFRTAIKSKKGQALVSWYWTFPAFAKMSMPCVVPVSSAWLDDMFTANGCLPWSVALEPQISAGKAISPDHCDINLLKA